MRVSNGTEGWITHRSDVDIADRLGDDRMCIFGSQLHEEVVWVLCIMNRRVVDCFACLKQLRVLLADSRWLQAEHRSKHQMPAAERAIGHSHQPIRGEKFVASARA